VSYVTHWLLAVFAFALSWFGLVICLV
jgi:hypothetical protein